MNQRTSSQQRRPSLPRFVRLILLGMVLSVVLAATPVLAWTDAGHKIVASIAFRQLTPEQQRKLSELLEYHPRFANDFTGKMPVEVDDEEVSEWRLQQAAIWPDIARRFSEENKVLFHRGPWHYINSPLFLTDADRLTMASDPRLALKTEVPATEAARLEMNVLQTIAFARQQLADPSVSKAERAVLLCWLCHLVGDLHQPLHSTASFSQKLYPEGDHGGNLIRTQLRSNLHSLWDGFPGGKLNLREARNDALTLMANPELQPLGPAAAAQLDHLVWFEESRKLALLVVYTPEILTPLQGLESERSAGETAELSPIPKLGLSEEYLRTGGHVAQRRLVEAGYRLGAVLAEIP